MKVGVKKIVEKEKIPDIFLPFLEDVEIGEIEIRHLSKDPLVLVRGEVIGGWIDV